MKLNKGKDEGRKVSVKPKSDKKSKKIKE